jgi:hypothetical protein
LLDILTMYGSINVKSPNNISNWQMGFNSAFKGLIFYVYKIFYTDRRWSFVGTVRNFRVP